MLEFRVLGPIEVFAEGERVELGKGMERALLAALVLAGGNPASTEELVTALWGERPPATAPEMLRNYVARLRGRLGSGLVETTPAGYRLAISDEAIDLRQFRRLAESGGRALEAGDPSRASADLRAALGLWRGRPLPELDDVPEYTPLVAALEEQRLHVQEEWVEAELALGRPGQVIHELEALHEQHPYRERLLGQLMLALYRSGRQKDALDRYASGRRRLLEDVGLEPSAELQQLQHGILRQDPALAAAPPSAHVRVAEEARAALRVPARRRRIVAFAVVAVLGVGVATGLAEWTSATSLAIPSRGIVELDARNGGAVSAVALHLRPGLLAVADGRVWAAAADSPAVLAFSARAPTRRHLVRIPEAAFSLAAAGRSLWVANGFRGTISRIDETGRVTTFRPQPRASGRLPLAAGFGQVWVASQDGTLTRLDRTSAHGLRTYGDVGEAEAIAIGGDGIWLASATSDAVKRFDPHSRRVSASVPVGGRPTSIAIGDGSVWALTPLENTLWRIDPGRNAVVQKYSVPSGSTALAWTPGRIWIGFADGLLTAIDTGSNRIAKTQSLDRPIDGLVGAGRTLWASIG